MAVLTSQDIAFTFESGSVSILTSQDIAFTFESGSVSILTSQDIAMVFEGTGSLEDTGSFSASFYGQLWP